VPKEASWTASPPDQAPMGGLTVRVSAVRLTTAHGTPTSVNYFRKMTHAQERKGWREAPYPGQPIMVARYIGLKV